MSVLTWADTHICAAHMGDGKLHGHTWKVRAYWTYEGQSAVWRQEQLKRVIGKFDHEMLPDELARAEDLAGYIGDLVDAVRVDVWRDPEGLGATWTP